MPIKKFKDKPVSKYKHWTKEMHAAFIKKMIAAKNKRAKENK